MLRGFYIAANGLIQQQRNIDTISNNVSNAHTAGYKADKNVQNTFKRELILLNEGRKNKTGTFEYKYTEETDTNLSQGSFEFTKRPLDLAIEGPMYFSVSNANGQEVLTRNGQFGLDNEGFLNLDGAGRVQGQNGDIYIGTSDFSVNNNGEIFIDGMMSDTLKLTYIDETSDVQKDGENTFTINGENPEMPEGTKFSVIQGAYERSNVDMAEVITDSMQAQSSFQSMSRIITMFDKVNEKTVSQLGKM